MESNNIKTIEIFKVDSQIVCKIDEEHIMKIDNHTLTASDIYKFLDFKKGDKYSYDVKENGDPVIDELKNLLEHITSEIENENNVSNNT